MVTKHKHPDCDCGRPSVKRKCGSWICERCDAMELVQRRTGGVLHEESMTARILRKDAEVCRAFMERPSYRHNGMLVVIA